MKRFIVVLPKENGGVEVHPMKEWLRQHPDYVPAGLDATSSTSHQLRNGLRKQGWTVEELETEIRLIVPGVAPSAASVDSVLGSSDEGEAGSYEPSFALEYQLRDFLAENLGAISVGGGLLKLYVDPAGSDGIEYPTAVGPIDILAIDDSGHFVVFELKRARSPDRAIGQVARYMGWVKQTIGRGKEVRGVIVAKNIDDKLRYAASVVPNVSLFEYSIEFHLRPADVLPETP